MLQIFQDEIDCGLEEKIKASSSIAYLAEIRQIPPQERERIVKASLKELLKLGIKDYSDNLLYYNKSILVSTGWNLNDDVFDKGEVWQARHTPDQKPSNLDHNEKLIVGHMTGVWAIDELGELISDDCPLESLPDYFHLFTNNVIYLHWEDQDYAKLVASLIERIENKEKYVSMECLFSNFDYALRDEHGGNKVVARQGDTAHLTKYLRSYGGSGIYRGMKIGRLLRGISFSGKGYVDKPANPESVIFSERDFYSFAKATILDDFGVLNNDTFTNRSPEMADDNELISLRKELEELKAAKAELEAQLAKADIIKLKEENDSFRELLAAAQKTMEDDKKKMEEKDEEVKKSKSELEAALAQITEFKAEAEKMQKKAKYDKRVAELTNIGVSNEEAEKTVSKFEALDDESFAFIVELAGRASKKDDTTKNADAALDNIKPDETQASLADANDEGDKTEKTRAQLIDVIRQTLVSPKKKTSKK